MTSHQVYASKIAVSDDGSRTLKRTKKTRANEKTAANQSMNSYVATRFSMLALLFVVGLNVQLYSKVIFFDMKKNLRGFLGFILIIRTLFVKVSYIELN
jgi:hypothetical protein